MSPIVSSCQPELDQLVHAVNNNPTEQNVSALFAFVQNKTGQTMEEHLGADWEQLIQNGETIERSIPIPECDLLLRLTLGGTQTATATCAHLPVPPPISFGKNDFDLSEVISFTSNENIAFPHVESSPYRNYYYEDDRHSDIHVHLEEPEFVYLETRTHGGGKNQTLLNRIGRVGYLAGEFLNYVGIPVAGGANPSTYYPFYRIKGSYSCKIEVQQVIGRNNRGPFGEPLPNTERWRVYTQFPLMGFHPILRWEQTPTYGTPFSADGGPLMLTSQPIQFGEWERSTLFAQSIVKVSHDTDMPAGYEGERIWFQVPDSQATFYRAASRTRRDSSFWLPYRALGEPGFYPNADPSMPGEYDWSSNEQVADQFDDLNFNSGGAGPDTREEAWDLFVDQIEEYQAKTGPYDPVLVLDEENMEIRVSFEKDENACYLPELSCRDGVFSNSVSTTEFTNPPYNNPVHTKWVMSWGGMWHDLGEDGISGWDEGAVAPYTQVLDSANRRGYGSSSFVWLEGLACRLATNGNFPGDNADYALDDSWNPKSLPLQAGLYYPTIEGTVVEPELSTDSACPKDARCITPGIP
jgi:hypothetical protein